MATARHLRMRRKVESKLSPRPDVQVPDCLARLLLALVLLALALMLATAILSTVPPPIDSSDQTEFKPDDSTQNINDLAGKNRTKPSLLQIIINASIPARRDRSNIAYTTPLFSPTASTYQEGTDDDEYRNIKEEDFPTPDNLSSFITKDPLDNVSYGQHNYNWTTMTRDEKFNETLRRNENYIKHELPGSYFKIVPSDSEEKEKQFIFRFIMFTFCIGVVYCIYHNKKKIFFLIQCRRKCFKTMEYRPYNVNEANPSVWIDN